jgi:hypothetical protein
MRSMKELGIITLVTSRSFEVRWVLPRNKSDRSAGKLRRSPPCPRQHKRNEHHEVYSTDFVSDNDDFGFYDAKLRGSEM